jgi:hypothetical protein
MRTYDELPDAKLEELLRERAFKEDAELHVAKRPGHSHEWIAAFKQYNVGPPEIGDVILQSAEAPTKREALTALAQMFDVEELIEEHRRKRDG